MFGGFGLSGLPENSIQELVDKKIQNITAISADGGFFPINQNLKLIFYKIWTFQLYFLKF